MNVPAINGSAHMAQGDTALIGGPFTEGMNINAG